MVTVEVDEEVWRHLTAAKNPGDSYNDVLRRELGLDDGDPEPAAAAPDRLQTALASWQPEDQVNTRRAREAAGQVVQWLAAQDGPRRKADVIEWAKAREDDTEYAPSTLWEKVAQPALSYLEGEGLVERTPNVGYEIVDQPRPMTYWCHGCHGWGV